MAAFPPDWQIYDNDQFATFTIPATADAGLGAALCIQIRPDGRATEHFKVTLFGRELIQAAFPATALFNLPEAAGLSLFFQCAPVEAAPRVDMTTTAWRDVHDMMRQCIVLILDVKGNLVDGDDLRSRIASDCIKKTANRCQHPLGSGSSRWGKTRATASRSASPSQVPDQRGPLQRRQRPCHCAGQHPPQCGSLRRADARWTGPLAVLQPQGGDAGQSACEPPASSRRYNQPLELMLWGWNFRIRIQLLFRTKVKLAHPVMGQILSDLVK